MSRLFLTGKSIVWYCSVKKCPCVHIWVNSQNSHLTDFECYRALLAAVTVSQRSCHWVELDLTATDFYIGNLAAFEYLLKYSYQ